VIITNRSISEPLARAISEIFSEVIIAPAFDPAARALLQKKKNLRLMVYSPDQAAKTHSPQEIRSVIGGLLVQDQDLPKFLTLEEKVVTSRPPTKSEIAAMSFGWKVVKHVKSNAIVIAGPNRTIGIGAGQMSRVDSARIAIWKAKEAGLSIQGSAVASDAFFPFPDGLISVADEGVSAAIQPGGSVRDADVIAAANERNLAMVFTGMRHFKH
jgi:phosphoribosylaminoimidazolecarboxamide formyltransferase/IMP cyclohydrolase